MGDFLLDLRPSRDGALEKAAEFLKFFPDMEVFQFNYPRFRLVLSLASDPNIWAPYVATDGSMLVALSGRIALDQKDWEEAAGVPGKGGLACKFIYQSYLSRGIAAVEALSGNFVAVVFDRRAGSLFVVTDRWGLFPAFRFDAGGGRLAYGSHPDALADAVGESRNWDLTSFAEFILAGRLSAPFTYYQRLQALPVASTTTLSIPEKDEVKEHTHNHFEFTSRPQPESRFDEIAEHFAVALKRAVRRRTLPVLGRSAIALSGGLDSRTVLSAAPDRKNLISFSLFNEENREFKIAKSIAQAAGVEFIGLKRDFDYYGDHAALGVKISAGMGCIASNHFLGSRSKLKELGIENLLTGCYCDYLFKGLALNKQVNSWTSRERVNSFDFSFYSRHFQSNTALARSVRQRLEGLFPPELRRYDTESSILEVEQRRLLPLFYEEDNAERMIPQRTMGWYVPIADNDLTEIFLKMSCSMKLNRRLFARMVEIVCGEEISSIPDANTGARVNASILREAIQGQLLRVEALARKLKPSNATGESWLNWNFYANHSRVVQTLWSSPNAEAQEIFKLILGEDRFSMDIGAYRGRDIYLFLQLFTLKLWFDQRS
jgi:asparagine synthetase B (glutamine-hydrolysing)